MWIGTIGFLVICAIRAGPATWWISSPRNGSVFCSFDVKTYIGVFTDVSAALSVFLSRSVGAKDLERGRSAIWHSCLIAFVLGLIMSLVSVFLAVPLLHIMGAHGTLQVTAYPYFTIVLGIWDGVLLPCGVVLPPIMPFVRDCSCGIGRHEIG